MLVYLLELIPRGGIFPRGLVRDNTVCSHVAAHTRKEICDTSPQKAAHQPRTTVTIATFSSRFSRKQLDEGGTVSRTVVGKARPRDRPRSQQTRRSIDQLRFRYRSKRGAMTSTMIHRAVGAIAIAHAMEATTSVG